MSKEDNHTNINTWIYPIAIYEFIKQNSDEEHHITVSEIMRHLKQYAAGRADASVQRNVTRHIKDLVLYDENIRVVLKNNEEDFRPEETDLKDIKDIYYDQPFSAGDIRILSDAIIYSTHLKHCKREDLLRKIADLRPSHSNLFRQVPPGSPSLLETTVHFRIRHPDQTDAHSQNSHKQKSVRC